MSCEWFIEPEPPCPCCKRGFGPVRIGVSAIGWVFSFDSNDAIGLVDEASWRAHLADKVIVDEYGKRHTPSEFFAFVDQKRDGRR